MLFVQFPIPLVTDTDSGPQVSQLVNEIILGQSYSVLFLSKQTFSDDILSEILICKLGKRLNSYKKWPKGAL